MSDSNHLDFNVNEYSSWILSQGSPHNCIIVAGVTGNMSTQLLQQAVRAASGEQPMLKFSKQTNHCHFVPTKQSITIQLINDNGGWRKTAENELAKPFLDNEALARITLVKTGKTNYIVLCFHHMIGDGTSGIDFLTRVIELYNQPNSSIITIKHGNMILPSPNPILLPDTPPAASTLTKIQGIVIEQNVMTNIEKRAKQSSCSVNAYLSSQIIKSASEVFNVPEFNVSMSVDLRRKQYHQPSISPLQFLTSWIDFKTDATIRNLSKTIHVNIRKKFKEKQHIINLQALNQAINQRSNNSSFASGFISKQPTICISNTGVIDATKATLKNSPDSLKLVEIHLSVNAQSYMGTPDSFTVQISRLKDLGGFININYPDPLVCKNKIGSFLKHIQHTLTL